MVAYQLEHSACNRESTVSCFVQDSFCEQVAVSELLEQVLHTQLRCNTTAFAPLRSVSALLNLSVRRVI